MTAADIERDAHRRARELFPMQWTNYAEMHLSRKLFIAAYTEGYLEGAKRMNQECTELIRANLQHEQRHRSESGLLGKTLSSLVKLMRSRLPAPVDGGERWER